VFCSISQDTTLNLSPYKPFTVYQTHITRTFLSLPFKQDYIRGVSVYHRILKSYSNQKLSETNTVTSEHMPQPAYLNLCWSQVESDEARRHLYFQWSVNFYFYHGGQFLFLSRGSPICSALFFKLTFKNNKFLNLYYRMLRTSTSLMSLILNILIEISVMQGNPQTPPQIRMDDVEAESCLNITAIISPNNLCLIIICRLGTCARSTNTGALSMLRNSAQVMNEVFNNLYNSRCVFLLIWL
jgi:hypothetical protein